MRATAKHRLDFDKTLPYFLEKIKYGFALSEKVIETINLNEGFFFTILPVEAQLDKLYQFSYGGIIPPTSYGDQTYVIEGFSEEFHPQQVITMEHELSEWVVDFIKTNQSNIFIVEDVLLTLTSKHSNIEDVRLRSYENEVYYQINNANSIDQIYKTIRKSSHAWHFFAICSVLKNINDAFFSLDDFIEICNHAKYLIVGAYDGEGYIFWEKR